MQGLVQGSISSRIAPSHARPQTPECQGDKTRNISYECLLKLPLRGRTISDPAPYQSTLPAQAALNPAPISRPEMPLLDFASWRSSHCPQQRWRRARSANDVTLIAGSEEWRACVPHAAAAAAAAAETWRKPRPEWAASRLSEPGRWGCGRSRGRVPGSQRNSEGVPRRPGAHSDLGSRRGLCRDWPAGSWRGGCGIIR